MNNRMNNVIQLPDEDDLRMEAASWITVLGRDRVSNEDLAGFKAWLGKSDRHQAVFESLSALSAELPILKELDDIGEATVARFPANQRIFPRRAFVALAASVAIIAVFGGAYMGLAPRFSPQHLAIATAVGEQKSVELRDGSTVELNTATRLVVDFTPSRRNVHLERGEAYFSVAKNPSRPFSVYAEGRIVTAIGTAFTVRVRQVEVIEVIVEKGRVELTAAAVAPSGDAAQTQRREGGGTAVAQLGAGQSVIYQEQIDSVKQMQKAELDRKLAWRKGMLAYSGEPLSEVIADISRYTDVKIEIADPSLLERKVAGYFLIDDVRGSIDSLVASFGLSVEVVSGDRIRLRKSS